MRLPDGWRGNQSLGHFKGIVVGDADWDWVCHAGVQRGIVDLILSVATCQTLNPVQQIVVATRRHLAHRRRVLGALDEIPKMSYDFERGTWWLTYGINKPVELILVIRTTFETNSRSWHEPSSKIKPHYFTTINLRVFKIYRLFFILTLRSRRSEV